MRWNSILMLVLAVVFGGLAILAGRSWLARQAQGLQREQAVAAAPAPEPVKAATVVVAAEPLRYGQDLEPKHLREVAWPADALPPGVYRTVGEVISAGERRVVLSAMEPNEPVLAHKITGKGQRGTLSALIGAGMGAVTIQVNEVVGLSGFVLPGDRVDVLLTRHESGGDGGQSAQKENSFSDIVVQNVKVLAAGQVADETAATPISVTAVTLEVDRIAAQKVAVAVRAGTLSLMLRPAGDVAERPGRRVALGEIGHSGVEAGNTTMIRVARGGESKEYSVLTETRPAPQIAAPPEKLPVRDIAPDVQDAGPVRFVRAPAPPRRPVTIGPFPARQAGL